MGDRMKPAPPELFTAECNTYNVEDFIFQCELYFRLTDVVSAKKRVLFAASRLSGSPLLWFKATVFPALTADDDTYDWLYFCHAISKEFTPVNAIREARDLLSKLQQDGTVRSYISQFRLLCMRIPDISDDEMLDKFLRGLDPKIRLECELREVDSVESAAHVAERYYAALNRIPTSVPSIVPIAPTTAPYHSNGFEHTETTAPAVEPFVPTEPSAPFEAEPMELGTARLSPADQQRLLNLQREGAAFKRLNAARGDHDFLKRVRACLHCRKIANHMKSNCPLKQNK